MSWLPVHSDGSATNFLWLYNGVQEGDRANILIVLHCKFYGRVNTVCVLKEALFIDFLVDNKGVIHKPAPEPGGWGAVLRDFCS